MSSSYIVEPQESCSKKDDTLIIVVNDDGTIAVDQETLQNLIMNQSNANVSVVRVGQTEGDAANGDLTFTVDPPAFVPPHSTPTVAAASTTDTALVDPFMEMDPEQLEKLETALQSEQAKQILGENVAAMLDMLTVEEQQNTIRYAIELDHCYTSRSSPADPEPLDPLPVANSPEITDIEIIGSTINHPPTQAASAASTEEPRVVTTPAKPLVKVKQPVGRPRKHPLPGTQPLTSPTVKSPPILSRNAMPKTAAKLNEEKQDAELSTSSESSESADSDNDSDFGPRGPRRPGVRARGGRRGLTTRGGSMTGGRRRGLGKRMDIDQARRLDIEMAAAVTAMKQPEQLEKTDKVNVPMKKQLKTIPSRKKEEIPLNVAPVEIVADKPLQTTNQVKANLISANMIKGEMILTKPGQGRNNQRVFFVQKKVVVKPNELKTLGANKHNPVILTKESVKVVNQIQTKLVASDEGKLVSVVNKPVAPSSPQLIQTEAPPAPVQAPIPVVSPVLNQSPTLIPKQPAKVTPVTLPLKIKPSPEIKKEKKKSESIIEPLTKIEDPPKPLVVVDPKTPELLKKHVKKDQRKSPGNFADALGPALFSTPDIIRRVSIGVETKGPETNSLPLISNESSLPETAPTASIVMPAVNSPVKTDFTTVEPEVQPENPNLLAEALPNVEDPVDELTSNILDDENKEEDSKLLDTDDLQSPLDTASNSTANEEVARPSEDSVPNIISDQNGIESEEHLLATLEMEASKHEEELLAEALLLQEQLDVDLTDPTVLDAPTSVLPDQILSPSAFDSALLPATSGELPIDKLEDSILEPDIHTTPVRTLNSAEQLKKKDLKEPIQIVRGGRVITLPPIEAPTTRSKRAQTKPELSPKTPESAKKDEKLNKQTISPQIKQFEEMDSEMDDDEEEDNSDSEDDPDRLWCICKRPHNNRFMICCDVCEDWFHGKCVHVSKAMGQQMEEQGIEWVCPNCAKKKIDNSTTKTTKSPSIKSPKIPESSFQNATDDILSNTTEIKTLKSPQIIQQIIPATGSAVTQCVVCKKEARNSSIYCSDACILMHAQETLTKDKPTTHITQPKLVKTMTGEIIKPSPDARVIVFERRTGKVLTGTDAPTTSNLKIWLKEHPTFEVVRPNNLNTLQIGGKTVTAIQTQSAGRIGKLTQSQPSTSNQTKMVFAKVIGSKQTVLAASNKKSPVSNLQNINILSKSTIPGKQILMTSNKNSGLTLKQTTLKIGTLTPGKSTVTTKQTPNRKIEPNRASTSAIKPVQKSPAARKAEPEPIRLNVRKTLAELLTTRIKETEDLTLNDEEIFALALNIELEMYKYFRDTGSKYKAKYRSLVFNIKDTKNLTLFRKIADKSLTADAVVRLSPDEMASQELAEWREKETKHQLEMIKKNELDLMAQAKSIVVKTHKGEQIIENDGGLEAVDPKTPVQDIVTALNSTDNTCSDILEEKEETTSSSLEETKKLKRDIKKKKDKDRERDKERGGKDSKRESSSSRSRHHRSRDRSRDYKRNKDGKRDKDRDRDRERDRDKDKERDKNKDKDKHKEKDRSRRSSKSSSTRSKSTHREHKDKDKKRIEPEDEPKREIEKKKESSPVQTDKPIEDRLWRHIEDETTTNTLDGNDSDVSDREPSSTVNIKTPDINEEPEREKEIVAEAEPVSRVTKEPSKGALQTVWRGFVNMVDVAKFFITAQEISGQAKDLMEDLPDTVDVVGRIGHETVWDYISKMKKTGSKEILVIRLTAANDEEKIPYITLYSYLNSRSRLGVVGNVSKNIKDFYIMPFSSNSQLPPVLMPLSNEAFEDQRPHLLLGIIVRNKRKRQPHSIPLAAVPAKIARKDTDRSYTPPPVIGTREKLTALSDKITQLSDAHVDKTAVTQSTLNSLNKAHVGMSRCHLDSAAISKIVPELSSKIDLSASPDKAAQDDDDAPYSPGDIAEDNMVNINVASTLMSPTKNSNEIQKKMDELNRQIEEQKMQLECISSSYLGENVPTLPGLGLDPPSVSDADEAYSPTDLRSFTPPPQGIAKFTQPILDKVSDITIPANLQEILANVKRQENSKVDPYLPAKPSASFLTAVNAGMYQKSVEKATYTPTVTPKESKSTLRSLSDMDLIKKAEEELAAVAAATAAAASMLPPALQMPVVEPDLIDTGFTALTDDTDINYPTSHMDSIQMTRISDQPKPPGLEDEDFPTFPSIPPNEMATRAAHTAQNFVPKSANVMSVKRKADEVNEPTSPVKAPRVKSRWSQGPID